MILLRAAGALRVDPPSGTEREQLIAVLAVHAEQFLAVGQLGPKDWADLEPVERDAFALAAGKREARRHADLAIRVALALADPEGPFRVAAQVDGEGPVRAELERIGAWRSEHEALERAAKKASDAARHVGGAA